MERSELDQDGLNCARRVWCFFDLGSTLEDESIAQINRARQTARLLEEHGVRISPDSFIHEMERTASRGASNIYDATLAVFGLSGDEIVQVRKAVHWDKTRFRLYQDARPILEQLSQIVSLGLIANQSRGSPSRLRDYGIADLFTVILTSAECGVSKPDSRIFRMAEEQAMVAPERIWMIGDRPDNDISPAKRRGWNTVRVLRGQHRHRQPLHESEHPTSTIASLVELPAIIGAEQPKDSA